jgi:hypothetical protein
VLCSLSSPANRHEETVTTSDFADVSMQSCMMAVPQLAEWMKQHPAERLARWRRMIGKRDGSRAWGGEQLASREFAADPIAGGAVLRDGESVEVFRCGRPRHFF